MKQMSLLYHMNEFRGSTCNAKNRSKEENIKSEVAKCG